MKEKFEEQKRSSGYKKPQQAKHLTLNKQTHGYISKLPENRKSQPKIEQMPKSPLELDNFILQSQQKQIIYQQKRQQPLKDVSTPDDAFSTQQFDSRAEKYEKMVMQGINNIEELESDKVNAQDQVDAYTDQNFNRDLLDSQIVQKIEIYKSEKDKKLKQFHKIVRDYEKADVISRLQKYEKKSIYEQLKLQEIELKKQLRINAGLEKPDNKKQQDQQEEMSDIIERNIQQQDNAQEYQTLNEYGYIPHSIPFSNQALFNNLSEKERFIKISTEFNKVKAQIDAHKHEDYNISYLYLKSKIGSIMAEEPNRDQVKNFVKFVKDERRLFDLTKTLEQIIIEAMNGEYNYDKLQELYEKKKRSQTADIIKTLSSHQKRLQDVLEQQYFNHLTLSFPYSKADLGNNYIVWNQKNDFKYDNIPNKYLGYRTNQSLRKRNKLKYQRKAPYGSQALKMQSFMQNYIEENKKLGAREFIPPSLEDQYSCAVNFNKETVNTVLNFAQESKVQLMSSQSTNTLPAKPLTADIVLPDLKQSADKSKNQKPPNTANIGRSLQQVDEIYAKVSKLHSVESESVFKRNRLMLEHVMLERAIQKLNNRKEKKEAQRGPTNDWKLRQGISNEVFSQDSKHRRSLRKNLSTANMIERL